MRHLAFRIFVIFIFTVLLTIYVIPWHNYWISVPFTGNDYKLWLDLQGWIELDYKVDFTELRKSEDFDKSQEKQTIEWLKWIIDKRIETLNINDSEINDASYGWEHHIIVQIPMKWNDNMENLQNIEKAKEAIWKVVKIQFKELRTGITEEDLQERKQIAENLFEELESWEKFSVVWDKYSLNYEKVTTWELPSFDELFVNSSDILVWEMNEVEKKDWDKWFLFASDDTQNNMFAYIYISAIPSEWMPATDSKWKILDDKYFIKSSVQFNEAYKPMIELTFNKDWADIFSELTKRLIWQQMAIFVGWEMLTSPRINEQIPWWKAVITWDYTVEEAKKLSQSINTWVVPAPIYLTSEKTIDSKIWTSALDKLIISWVIWFALIFLFLVFIYRISGLFAGIALFIYTILILTVVKMFWVVLTMASIAWLILSVWMAIDANILIFERVKEELRVWRTVLDATDIWFRQSWSAIWDSNFTSLITAVVLFIFWINMIKWFGVMLAIWIILSLFTVMWISRVFLLFLASVSKNKLHFVWFKKIENWKRTENWVSA